MIRRAVVAFWDNKLKTEASSLPSISHMGLSHMLLTVTSPLITTCHGNPHEVRKATIQLRMLSGRYRTDWLRRHWSGESSGFCRVPGCNGSSPGTLSHLATGDCPGLALATQEASTHWTNFLNDQPYLRPLILQIASGDKAAFLGFLLDPTTHHLVISLTQSHGDLVTEHVCHLTRSWLYIHHRARFRALDLWEALI